MHNPSVLALKEVRIPIIDGISIVKSGDQIVPSQTSCNADWDQNLNHFASCFLTIQAEIPPLQITTFSVSYISDGHAKIKFLAEGMFIEKNGIKATFMGYKDRANAQFTIQVEQGDSKELLTFSTKYWSSYIDYFGTQQNSGDYIFRPMANQFTPNVYSYLDYANLSEDTMSFYFAKNATARYCGDERMIVHVSIDADLGVLRYMVDMDSIPGDKMDGYEVIVDFSVANFDNNQTFWTDSNGLEMQKRILNYRPTWDIQANYNDSNENVTANYYPINSAMSMRDVNSNRQFTVMNDRPQSGSALGKGAF